MLESYSVRGWVVPRVQERERLNKPPLVYWAQAATAGVLTGWDSSQDAIWMYRIPSLLAAIITILATWRLGCVLFPGVVGARTGLLAGFLLAAAPIFVWEARQARADHLLVMCTTLAMWLFAAVWRTRHQSQPWLRVLALWLFVALGVLTKGPITPMVGLLTILALCWWTRSWRWTLRLRPVLGVFIVIALALPWILLVGSEVGFARYWSIVYDEILGRSMAPKEGHSGPPGYHLLLSVPLFLPGAMLMGAAIYRTCARTLTLGANKRPASRVARLFAWIRRLPTLRAAGRRDAELFLLGWIVPSWIVFELVSTKLPHYTMPLYPAVALLTARCIYATAGGFVEGLDRGIARVGILAWAVAGLLTLALGPVALVFLVAGTQSPAIFVLLLAFGSIVACDLALRAIRRGDLKRAQALGLAIGAVSMVSLLGLVLPSADRIFVSHRLAKAIHVVDPNEQLPLATVGFHEDSLVFNTQGRIQRIDQDQLIDWLAKNPQAVVVLPIGLLEHYPQLTLRLRVAGFNYSNGEQGEWGVAVADS